jgi:mycothiol synthase
MNTTPIAGTNSPSVSGLILRPYHGPSDLPAMLGVITRSEAFDGEDNGASLESLSLSYTATENFTPLLDTVIAEVAGTMVGYGRVRLWAEINDGPLNYEIWGCLVPDWRRRGIGRALLQWLEQRAEALAAGQPAGREKRIQAFSSQAQAGRITLLDQHSYRPVRQSHTMVRPTLDGIPDFPLPDGVELRPALPKHYRAIWDADRDAFADHWGAVEPTEDDYQLWLANPLAMQPALWQIAWDTATDQIAGQVRTFINRVENERYQRQRGFTEEISVARPWRRRGLARALIALSLKAQKSEGMSESELSVDSTNTTGANSVYEACGFQVVKTYTIYQKVI